MRYQKPDMAVDSFIVPNHGTLDSVTAWRPLDAGNISASFLGFWTTVTSDAHLVEELLIYFFEHIHSLFHWFDMFLFIADMNSRQTNFCTPLLVNAVLAAASATKQEKDANGQLGVFTELSARFYQEAREHWHAQEGQDSIIRTQASMIMTYVLNQQGRDKVGMMFQAEALRTARTLGLFNVEPPLFALTPPFGISQDNWDLHRTVTAWALYNWEA